MTEKKKQPKKGVGRGNYGPRGGWKLSKATRDKMSKAKTGVPLSEDARENQRKGQIRRRAREAAEKAAEKAAKEKKEGS